MPRASRLFLRRMGVSLAVAAVALLGLTPDAVAQAPDTWSSTGSLTTSRAQHTSTLLLDGTVLAAGGFRSGTVLSSAEVYDTSTGGIWSPTGSLAEARSGHTATRLADGKVLVAGGASATAYIASAEIYDPSTRTWSPAGSMMQARYAHTATLLPDGRVLVTGGDATAAALGPPEVFLASAEVYDPSTGTWSPTGSMATGRLSHTATLLSDGRVLVAGGAGQYVTGVGFVAVDAAEVYDPSTGTWSQTGRLRSARYDFTATRLDDGRVLAAGGVRTSALDAAEVYDPSTGTWSFTASMAARRWVHSAARLPDGRVMVVGGFATAPPPAQQISTASAEVYDPSMGAWSPMNGLATARTYHTATALLDGRILVAGGYNRSSFFSTVFLASAEVYNTAFVPPPALSIDDASIVEGDAGTTLALFTVTLSAASTQVITVDFATADGTAMAASDYTASSGTVTFNPGVTTKTIATQVNGDSSVEPDETFFVNLGNAINATIADTLGLGTIINDDVTPPSLSIDDVSVIEADAGRMATARSSHTATLLLDGRVLAAGRGSAEMYDPSTGTWSPAGIMSSSRFVHTATLLLDGRVLVAGGWDYVSAYASAEVYDPSTGAWSAAGSMAQARWDHSATLLPNGKVLVAGGTVVAGGVTLTLASSEVFDPATGTWSSTGSMARARANHTATRLLDGRVLVIGGRNNTASAEVYDPSTGTWSPAGSMSVARGGHASTLLPGGRVLVAGGFHHNVRLASAEVYDPAANTWSATGNMTAARYWFSDAWVLANGRVLVAGSFGGKLASAELYDPSTGTWSATASMAEGRGAHRTTRLLDGRVLVTGGQGVGGPRLASSEVYNPATGAWSSAGTAYAVFTVTLSPASAQIVTVDVATADGTAAAGSDYTAGAGAVTFNPGDTMRTITILVHGDIAVEPDETFFVNLANPSNAIIADSQGQGTIVASDAPPAISINDVTVTEGDAGFDNVMFTVSLSAASSQPITVQVATADGTAIAPQDYTPKSITLTFNPGQTEKPFVVRVRGDLQAEPDETFFVGLSNPTDGTIADGQGQGTILNDDAQPTISIDDVTVTEGNAGFVNAVFTVSLSGPSSKPITVQFATADAVAAAPQDYQAKSGTVAFNPGQISKTVVVRVRGDLQVEASETFLVNLTNPANATIADSQGLGTVLNDD